MIPRLPHHSERTSALRAGEALKTDPGKPEGGGERKRVATSQDAPLSEKHNALSRTNTLINKSFRN